MAIVFAALVKEAQSTERAAFVVAYPHFFLVGALQDPARSEDVDADSLYGEEQQLTFVSSPTGTPGSVDSSDKRLILAVRKRQPTFPQMITIGRTANNDLVIPDTSISRFHAYFRAPLGRGLMKDVLELCDSSSSNGTFVGDARVESRTPTLVRSGDQIRFGSVLTRVLDSGSLWDRLQRFGNSPPEP